MAAYKEKYDLMTPKSFLVPIVQVIITDRLPLTDCSLSIVLLKTFTLSIFDFRPCLGGRICIYWHTVETVICDPSRDLNEKVAYDRGSLNTVSIQQPSKKVCGYLTFSKLKKITRCTQCFVKHVHLQV